MYVYDWAKLECNWDVGLTQVKLSILSRRRELIIKEQPINKYSYVVLLMVKICHGEENCDIINLVIKCPVH